MNKKKRPPMSPLERQRLKMEQNQIAAKQIRKTLIIIAIIAGCWFLYLSYKNKNEDSNYNPFPQTESFKEPEPVVQDKQNRNVNENTFDEKNAVISTNSKENKEP